MKPNIPWSVKGIDPEAREAAKTAARRAGMTLGEWLNSLILQGGDAPDGLEAAVQRQFAAAGSAGQDPLAQPQVAPGEPFTGEGEAQSSAMAVSGIDQSIERLASTIESSRRMLAGSEADTRRTLGDLVQRLETMEKNYQTLSSADQGSAGGVDQRTLQALERAISGVASHIEKSDRRNTDLVASVEQALGELSGRVSGVEETASEAINRLELGNDRLAGRLDQIEGEQRRSAARINERVATLDARVAEASDTANPMSPDLTDRLERLDRRLYDAETEISSKAAAVDNDRVGRSDFYRLERRLEAAERAAKDQPTDHFGDTDSKITALTERLDRLYELTERRTQEAVSEAQTVARKADEQVGASEARIDRVAGDLDDRVNQLSDRAEKTEHTTAAALAAMKEVVEQLSNKIDQLSGKPVRPAALVAGGLAAAEVSRHLAEPEARSVEDQPPAEDEIEEVGLDEAPLIEKDEAEVEARLDEATDTDQVDARAAESDLDEETPAQRSWHERVFGRAADDDERVFVEPGDTDEEDEDTSDQSEAPVLDHLADDEADENLDSTEDDFASAPVEDQPSDPLSIADDLRDEIEETLVDHPGEQAPDTVDDEASEDSQEDMGVQDDDDAGLKGFDWSSFRRKVGEQEASQDLDDQEYEEQPSEADEVVEELDEHPHQEEARAREDVFDDDEDEDDYLNQARQAARSAGELDRGHGRLLDDDDDQRKGMPSWLLMLLMVVIGALLIVVLWVFGRPLLDGFINTPTTPPPVTAPSDGETVPEVLEPSTDGVEPDAGSSPDSGDALGSEIEEIPGNDLDAATPAIDEAGIDGDAPSEASTSDAGDDAAPLTPQAALASAANDGEPQAQYALALAYQSGRGVTQDAVEAVKWMRMASDNEFAAAQFGLGYILEKGAGVPGDEREARLLYERAARAGNFKAMHNLAMFHVEGKGGLQPDGAQAKRWFEQAAELGLVDSQMNLAILYHRGGDFGIEQSAGDAYFWYSLAAARGDEKARQYADDLAAKLPSGEKALVDQRIANWTPAKLNLLANGGFDTSAESFLPAEERAPLTRSELARIQEMLAGLGYEPGPADGRPGAKTEAAIRAFEADFGLPETGVADRDLLTALGVVPR